MTPLNILFLLAFVVVMFMMMKKGGGCCGGHDHGGHADDPHSGHTHGDGNHEMHHHEQQAEDTKDPVCGMTVENPSLHSEHQGKKYSFCSESCRKNFDNDPGKYV